MVVALQKDQEMAAHWKTQVEQCDKANNRWIKRAEKISKQYRDERDEKDTGVARKLNLFWSNVQTLKPVYYSKRPTPIVERRFLDKDTKGRMASTILERALRYEVSFGDYDQVIRMCRLDWMVPGRGQVWVRYNPQFGEPISPKAKAVDDILLNGEPADEGRVEEEETQEREVVAESVCADYVHWKDFYTFPSSARHWLEVQGVGRRIYMSRQDLIDNFGDEVGKKIELDYPPPEDGNQGAKSLVSGQEGMQATVHEIWWRPERKVYFIAKGYDKLCKEADDPLKLEKFFPCPRPISATMTNDTMIPVPDYAECQDQYIQIDDLSKRIDILTSACKVVGVYDASAQSLKRVFEEAQEPNLIPVDSWAMFAEKGGLKGAIDWVPVEAIAKTLQILIEVRAKIIEDLDRLTGISDVMRGTSDSRETMGGQRLKSNNSSTRSQEPKDEMARFCCDIIEIMGEIIAEHYSPETLIQVSGAMYDEGLDPPALPPVLNQPPSLMGHNGGPPLPSAPPSFPAPMPPQAQPPAMSPQPAGMQPPGMMAPPMAPSPPPEETPEQKQQRKLAMIMDAIALLRQDKLRGFRIDIETDSTVQGDAEQEKASRIEFLKGVTEFIKMSAEVVPLAPASAPLFAKMLQFGVRGFRVGRDLESAIEDFCEKAEADAKAAAANPRPDPEMMKAQSEIERQKIENEGEQANNAANLRIQEMDVRMKEMDIKIAELKANAEVEKNRLESERQEREDHYENLKHQREMERNEKEHSRAMELGEMQHKQKMTAASKPNGASHA